MVSNWLAADDSPIDITVVQSFDAIVGVLTANWWRSARTREGVDAAERCQRKPHYQWLLIRVIRLTPADVA